MKKLSIVSTNMLVCLIITLGFLLTSWIGYRSNTSIFIKDAKNVSELASEGIYFQIEKIFAGPVHVSLTMANDSLLKNMLMMEHEHLEDPLFLNSVTEYLNNYREKYKFESVFLVSTRSNRYYHYTGLDRVLARNNPENIWYYQFLNQSNEYELNVDNDEADHNNLTVFVNCRIKDDEGRTIGIIGVGLKVDTIQALLKEYDLNYNVEVCLVDPAGMVQLSSAWKGYAYVNYFEKEKIWHLENELFSDFENVQTYWLTENGQQEYLISQYVHDLGWFLVVKNDMTMLYHSLNIQLVQAILVILLIILLVLLMITRMLRKYRIAITEDSIMQEREYQKMLNKTNLEFSNDVFEANITKNKMVGEKFPSYMHLIGAPDHLSLDKALIELANRQIKEEHRQGYLDRFLPINMIRAYHKGIQNFSYDFMIKEQDGEYHWSRVTAQVFYWPSDQSIHAISYLKNIDKEKIRELSLIEQSMRDGITGLYNKRATEEIIMNILIKQENQKHHYALLMFDIDHFKGVNDQYGHAFGDAVIMSFADELKRNFRDTDIIGRIGGDEFTVLMLDFTDEAMLASKLERFCKTIADKDFAQREGTSISCSCGAALFPKDGRSYSALYEKADCALYYAKEKGRSTYHLFNGKDETRMNPNKPQNQPQE
ncbi:MAG: sensor domain-containing diguanylate cyclase [Clostridia bacterium]